jgi:hypothetical protein
MFITNECSRLNMVQMEKWNGTTLDLWQEALPKHMSRLQETFAPMATFASIHTHLLH